MSPSNSVAQIIAQTAAELEDAFELPDPLPSNVYLLRPRRPAKALPTTIALELINRGPTTISIEGVESFRTKVLHLLSQIRPVIEHEAKVSLADWTDRLAAEPQVQRRAA